MISQPSPTEHRYLYIPDLVSKNLQWRDQCIERLLCFIYIYIYMTFERTIFMIVYVMVSLVSRCLPSRKIHPSSSGWRKKTLMSQDIHALLPNPMPLSLENGGKISRLGKRRQNKEKSSPNFGFCYGMGSVRRLTCQSHPCQHERETCNFLE